MDWPVRKAWLLVIGFLIASVLCFLFSHYQRNRPLPGRWTPPGKAPIQLPPKEQLEVLRLLATPGADGTYYPAFVPIYEKLKKTYETRKMYSNLLLVTGVVLLLVAGIVVWRTTRKKATVDESSVDRPNCI